MRDYRQLTQDEIDVLESNSCWAENWDGVKVAENFSPYGFHRVLFYGDIRLGVFEKQVEVSKGFTKHAGINDATLRNVTVGDNCLIEKVGNFINNYTIGDDCYISNICTMETTEGATFGEGHLISVLNEMGDGNVVLFHDLNSQLAAFMVKHLKDKQLKDSLTRLINEEIRFTLPERGTIGNSVKIINAKEITNGFTAEASVFFANSYMANGEACAAFCGPFSASHHKSSLLIGGEFSFYNAGSNTNFSNHAYKMGPMHYGTLERGSKTASGAYVLMPAKIGAFSVCFGKLMNHPDMRCLPFAYLMAYGETMYIVPGRNITTVGLYRDIKKWPKRDKRATSCRKSVINFDWLSPFTVGEIVQGKKILENLRQAGGRNVSSYNFQEYIINASSLRKGIKYYDIALRIYMGAVLKRAVKGGFLGKPTSTVGEGEWIDLSGLLLPASEEQRLIDDIKSGQLETIGDVLQRFYDINDHYREYQWAWTYKLILDYYGIDELTEQAMQRIREDYVRVRRAWIAEIRKDAQKEFEMGDVDQDVFDDFISKLDHEIDYED